MDSFFGIGVMELFFIAILALIVLGPERLPGVIREVMKHVRTARNLSSELTSQFSEELKALDEINPQKIIRELTEEPAKPAAKKATKPSGAKSGTKTAAEKKGAGVAATGAAKTAGSTTAVESKPDNEDESPVTEATDDDLAAEATGQTDDAEKPAEPENRILPPEISEPTSPVKGEASTDAIVEDSSGVEMNAKSHPAAPQEQLPPETASIDPPLPPSDTVETPPLDKTAMSVNGTRDSAEDAP